MSARAYLCMCVRAYLGVSFRLTGRPLLVHLAHVHTITKPHFKPSNDRVHDRQTFWRVMERKAGHVQVIANAEPGMGAEKFIHCGTPDQAMPPPPPETPCKAAWSPNAASQTCLCWCKCIACAARKGACCAAFISAGLVRLAAAGALSTAGVFSFRGIFLNRFLEQMASPSPH